MFRPAAFHPVRSAVVGHARPVRICRAAVVTEALAQYNESWTIHFTKGDTSTTSKSNELLFCRVDA